ncbi:RHS repeat-associated core domain-containing protein [Pseudomonas fulva]|nr:RHS repeat-associated core domain-containing protein [Pseudomonas fulva]
MPVNCIHLLNTDMQASFLGGLAFPARAYSPYGAQSAAKGPLLAFAGQPVDPLTGCYHLGSGHRTYNPVLMRFHTADRLSPFGKGGINAYAYCRNDPVNLVDPNGQFPSIIAPIRSIVTGILNLAISVVKGMRNYRLERDFAVAPGLAASRSGELTYGTVEAAVMPWTTQEKVLSGIGAVTASVSIGTGTGRLLSPQTEALAWVDMAVGTVATAVSAYELYGLATTPVTRRYPIAQVGIEIRRGATPPRETPV